MRQGLADAKRLAEVHRKGRSLISFPEGTFTRNPGLLPFHIGPFLTAVETSSPIVPVAIKGTRSIMHPESSLIRRGTVEVRILPAIEAPNELKQEANPWDKALRLRDISRRDILEFNGEPDLDIIRAVYQARTKFRSDFK